MLRLLYLLIRQRFQHARPALAGTAALTGFGRRRLRIAGLLALALGLAAYVLLGERHTPTVARVEPPAASATLTLLVDRVDSSPLLVYLESPGEAGSGVGEPARPHPAVHLTSVNAVFEPAFQVAPVSARVEVGNADAVAHNTHVFDGRHTLFNVALPLQGVPVTKVLGRSGLFEVRCDLHSWMRAAVFVPSNPHHAVIREPGEFALRGIAPGHYRLHLWTPESGKTTRLIDLAPGATLSLPLAAR